MEISQQFDSRMNGQKQILKISTKIIIVRRDDL